MARSFSQGAYNDQDTIVGMVQPTGRSLVRSVIPWATMPGYEKLLEERRSREIPGETDPVWDAVPPAKRKRETAVKRNARNPKKKKQKRERS